MPEFQKVILYGDSLLLTAIAGSLAGFPSLEVVMLKSLPISHFSDLGTLQASVVIFDLTEFPAQSILSLLENQPDRLLIGLDSAGERILLLSGKDSHTMTTKRLVQLINHMLLETGGETSYIA